MSALQLWLQNHNRKLTQDAIDEALMEYISLVESQRDELVEVLKYCRQKIAYMTEHGEWYSPGRAIEMADAAIASVKEK